jgi:hypothetical protein
MKHVLLAAAAIVAATGAVGAQTPPKQQDIAVTDAWARATAGAGKTGAAYVTVTDNGVPDRLTGASTPVAGMADLNETINANGVMQMRGVAGLPLEPGKPVTLAPGGYHVMLMDLKHPLKKGETFPLTLTFEHAKPITVQVEVAGPGASEPMRGSQKP